MQNIEQKLEVFRHSIEKQAQAKINQMEEEIEVYRKEQIDRAEDEILNESYRVIQEEVAKSKVEATLETAKKKSEYRKELLKKRNEYTESIFAEAYKMLKKFSDSSDYEGFLMQKTKKLLEFAPYENSEIQLRAEDMKFCEKIADIFGKGCTFSENKGIKIGGIKLVNNNQGIIVDETLDSALEEQKEWFQNNSGFLIAPH